MQHKFFSGHKPESHLLECLWWNCHWRWRSWTALSLLLWEIFSLCARNRTSENSVGLKRFSIHVDVNPSYWHLLIGRQPPHSDKLLNRIGPPMNKLGVYQSWLNINYCFDQKHRTVSMLFVAPMFATAASRLRLALCRCSTKLPLPRCPVLSNQWDFQEPKLEVPTIYKAYIRPM